MNKKAQKGLVIGGIIFFIIVVILVLVFIGSDNLLKKEQKKGNNTMSIYLRAKDEHYTNAKAQIFYQNQMRTNDLKADAYTYLEIPNNVSPIINCWSDNHYLTQIKKEFTPKEIQENSSKIECQLNRIGRLEIEKLSGTLINEYNSINLNITCREGFCQKLGVCYTWTAGILKVRQKNRMAVCKEASWLNYSKYHVENMSYEWLPENTYRCQNREEICTKATFKQCDLPEIEIPLRFKGQVDYCELTGITLSEDKSENIIIEVTTAEFKNRYDNVIFTFFDFEKRVDGTGELIWLSEKNGANIAGEDFEFEIKYLEG